MPYSRKNMFWLLLMTSSVFLSFSSFYPLSAASTPPTADVAPIPPRDQGIADQFSQLQKNAQDISKLIEQANNDMTKFLQDTNPPADRPAIRSKIEEVYKDAQDALDRLSDQTKQGSPLIDNLEKSIRQFTLRENNAKEAGDNDVANQWHDQLEKATKAKADVLIENRDLGAAMRELEVAKDSLMESYLLHAAGQFMAKIDQISKMMNKMTEQIQAISQHQSY